MANPVATGNLAHVTLPGKSPSIYVVRSVDQSKVYVSPESQPDALSLLYFENGKWKVSGSDLDFSITFTEEIPKPVIEEPYRESTPERSREYLEMLEILKRAKVQSYHIDEIYNDGGYLALDYDLSTDLGKFFTVRVSYVDMLDIEELIAAFRPGFGDELKDLLIRDLNDAIKDNYTAGVAYRP